MSRRYSERVAIDESSVQGFYADRAHRWDPDDPEGSILLQDANPGLAKRRHDHEVSLIKPWLRLASSTRVLDIGCGSGRWAQELASDVRSYDGTDVSADWVAIAEQQLSDRENVRFHKLSADDTAVGNIDGPFDLVILAGVIQCLNDASIVRVFENAVELCPNGQIYCRGPLAIEVRLTLDREWSTELEHEYSAVYRTQGEFLDLIQASNAGDLLELERSGLLYPPELSNREETRQHYWIWGVGG